MWAEYSVELEQPLIPEPAGRAERLALRVMQCGAIAVVLVSSTLNAFDLDRFFVPKELILHATAVMAGLLALRAIARAGVTRVDLLLAGYLLVGALSAAMATNRWLAMRALAISASGAVLFWTARPLLGAVVLTAATSLLQAYGMRILLFSENRERAEKRGGEQTLRRIARGEQLSDPAGGDADEDQRQQDHRRHSALRHPRRGRRRRNAGV